MRYRRSGFSFEPHLCLSYLRVPADLFAALASLVWITERLLNINTPVDTIVSAVAQHAAAIAGARFLISLACWRTWAPEIRNLRFQYKDSGGPCLRINSRLRSFCIIEVRGSSGGHMASEEQVQTRSSLSKVVLYATVISGFVAAYLMYRRGESPVSIAAKTVTNPVGSLVSEVKNVV
jgi:hypothetical protein